MQPAGVVLGQLQHGLDLPLMAGHKHAGMTVPIIHRVRVAIDCECGTTVEACDGDELLDELLEHIAAAHEAPTRVDPAALSHEAYEA